MTPSEYAAEKLAMWERALQEQRNAETALAAARKNRRNELILKLMPQVDFLRTKADLLLAAAVQVMRLLRDQSVPSDLADPAPDAPLDEDRN